MKGLKSGLNTAEENVNKLKTKLEEIKYVIQEVRERTIFFNSLYCIEHRIKTYTLICILEKYN